MQPSKWPIVRIDREVFERLRELAHGFETPNKVLRRLLGMPPKISKNRNGSVEDRYRESGTDVM